MVRRPRRTDTGLFLAATLVLMAAFLWPRHSPSDSPSAVVTPTNGQEAVATSDDRATSQSWSGELVLVTHERTLVARTSSGSERTLYVAPNGFRIQGTSAITDGSVDLALAGDRAIGRVDRVSLTDGQVTPGLYPPSSLLAPRPGSAARAEVHFSNAEREFGSAVSLVEGATEHLLLRIPQPISALAWRSDGEVLAIGVQAELILVQLAAGASRTVGLEAPIRALSWREGRLLILTSQGALTLPTDGASSQPLPLTGPIGGDLIGLTSEQFAWLAGDGDDRHLTLQTLAQPPVVTQITASQLIGVWP